MFLKVFRSKFTQFLQFILLFAIISMSTKATQPLLPDNFISDSKTSIEFRDFNFLPFSTESRDFSSSRVLNNVDKNKIFPFISFEDKPFALSFHRHFRIKLFHYLTNQIPVLDRSCILSI